MKTFHGETIDILVKTFLTALIGSQNKFNIQTIKFSNLWKKLQVLEINILLGFQSSKLFFFWNRT